MPGPAMQIAVLPARGGSKRVPRKNVRPFCGRPMIAWPIRAALDSGLFDKVVVTTEDDEIAAAARAAGAEVPFMRPAGLADDHTPTRAVVNHAITAMAGLTGRPVASACLIYATAAFLAPDDLRAARALLDAPGRDFVFAALPFAHPVQRALVEDGAGGVRMLSPEHAGTRSQDLPEAFHDAAQFYWGRAEAFLAGRPMFGPASAPYLLARDRAVDIDTPADWDFAEALMRLRQAGFAANPATDPTPGDAG